MDSTPSVDLQGLYQQLSQDFSMVLRGINHLAIQQAPILLDRCDAQPVRLHADVEHPIWNPAMMSMEDQYLIATRSSNFYSLNDGMCAYAGSPHNTINILHRLNHKLEPIHQIALDDSLVRTTCSAATFGIEDIRLFSWQGQPWGIGAAVCAGPKAGSFQAQQVLFRLDEHRIVDFHLLPSPVNARIEKNWTPLFLNDELHLIYSLDPLIAYHVDSDGSLTLIGQQQPKPQGFLLRGGTPFIPWNGKYLGLAHRAPFQSDRFYYTHVFVVIDRNLRLVETSPPFFLQRRGIEFAAGLINRENELVISYGVGDQAGFVAPIPHRALQSFIVN